MGNKDSKAKRSSSERRLSPSTTSEDLAGFLATLSDMAQKGERKDSLDLPSTSERLPPTHGRGSLGSFKSLREKRKRFTREKAVSEDLCYQRSFDQVPGNVPCLENNMDQDEGSDWEQMRKWLVWCMDENLRDDDMYTERQLRFENQSSMESNAET